MGQREDIGVFYANQKTLGTTQRYRDATTAELWYLGKIYEGMPHPDDTTVPFNARKPKIIVPLMKEAIDTIVRFTWGGHNFPPVTIEATRTDDDGARADEVGPRLDKEQAEQLTRFVRALVRESQLSQAVKEASRKAAITRSALLILGIRNGYITTHTEVGKHCTPEWDRDRPRRLKSVEIKYQFPKEVEDPPDSGHFKTKDYWYRRVVGQQRDVTYQEIPVVVGVTPKWVEDPELTFAHGYGFCPAVWFRPLPDDADQLDGTPLVDPQLYGLMDDVNRSVSQRGRSVRFVTDPQPVVSGLDEGEIDFVKNPGKPIYLPDAAAKVQYLEMTGVGIVRATEHVKELTEAFRAACSYVKANPETTSGNISGVVLEFLHAPMIALASDLRVDFGTNGYAAAIALLLQMCAVIVGRDQDVWVQGVGDAMELLTKAQLRGVWLDPPICIQWAPFFPETAADKQAKVTYTTGAEKGGYITRQTATKHVGPMFGVEDPEAEQDAVAKQQSEDSKQEMAELKQTTAIQTGAPAPKTPKGDTVPEEGD